MFPENVSQIMSLLGSKFALAPHSTPSNIKILPLATGSYIIWFPINCLTSSCSLCLSQTLPCQGRGGERGLHWVFHACISVPLDICFLFPSSFAEVFSLEYSLTTLISTVICPGHLTTNYHLLSQSSSTRYDFLQ